LFLENSFPVDQAADKAGPVLTMEREIKVAVIFEHTAQRHAAQKAKEGVQSE